MRINIVETGIFFFPLAWTLVFGCGGGKERRKPFLIFCRRQCKAVGPSSKSPPVSQSVTLPLRLDETRRFAILNNAHSLNGRLSDKPISSLGGQ